MELYLIQHGEALSKESDPERRLSPTGEEQVRIAGEALAALGVNLERIYSSPKKRAQQTARALAGALGMPEGGIGVLDALEPLAPPQETLEALKNLNPPGPALLAGHLPSLAEITAYLMDSRGRLAFRMGGVGCIELEQWKRGDGTLLWYLTPEHLRKIVG